eukprot:NODE_26138_length_562_cov_11.006897.p4 GENE.NODE_26138_length_562_cov_11.006897~~NODE_26138_length_562_cov_11.006897.p4  ORF type:complete len:58 (-),score=27.04 NODE_26138_length_562_cov_11.006897:133-306(-)
MRMQCVRPWCDWEGGSVHHLQAVHQMLVMTSESPITSHENRGEEKKKKKKKKKKNSP